MRSGRRCRHLWLFLWFLVLGEWAQALTLQAVYEAAKAENLPLRFFNEIRNHSSEKVRIGAGPSAKYYVYWNVISLPKKQHDAAPATWSAIEWSLFYNELFHAWWDLVLKVHPAYEITREKIAEYTKAYQAACPEDPAVAQEEAYSESIATLTLLIANRVPWERRYYKEGWTVAPVSHSNEDSKYTAAAESLYPSEEEYSYLHSWLTYERPPTHAEAEIR